LATGGQAASLRSKYTVATDRETKPMQEIRTLDRLEAVVGAPRPLILMKAVNALDDGCRRVLARAPVAWLGYRDRDRLPNTTLVGGFPGFARVQSPTRVAFDLTGGRGPLPGTGVSFVFMLPGIGETVRLNGAVVRRSGTRVVVEVQEVFVHCARCVLRSGIWNGKYPPTSSAPGLPQTASGPFADPAVAEFLTASPFAAISSWDGNGFGDTSPKGDHAGFLRILGPNTLAVPDRRGNQRTDTFHNILTCDQVSLAVVVPGRTDVLHLSGTAVITDDTELLRTMAVKGKAPAAALLVHVHRGKLRLNDAIRDSRMWDTASHVDPSEVPDLIRLSAQHLASNRTGGTGASATRALGRLLTAAPARLLRRGMDYGYRRQLEDEGY
jgi:predicted pyridoxine 5'-phosphate oxidase superfamily flavin-nucleotide-binding protein